MKRVLPLLVAVGVGVLLGACFREIARVASVSEARAQEGAPRYRVMPMSITPEGYAEDLNLMSAKGWRFVGAIPVEKGSHLVFEQR